MNTAGQGVRAVAIGGGTGLPIVLRALKDWVYDVAAIVTMADDGGSSGKLRQELGILPPGDIRNCLTALASPEKAELARMLQYRFPSGWTLAEHNLGNLIIAGMTDYKGGFVQAVETMAEMLGATGRVLPSTLEDINLLADLGGGSVLAGQALIARTEQIRHVHIEPREAAAFAPAVEAVRNADLIVIGPGSLFTSIMPNLLVGGIAEAIADSPARKVFILNVMNMRQETFSMTGQDYLEALSRHAPGVKLDVVIAHEGSCPATVKTPEGQVALAVEYDRASLEKMGYEVSTADLLCEDEPLYHDPDKLAPVLKALTKETSR